MIESLNADTGNKISEGAKDMTKAGIEKVVKAPTSFVEVGEKSEEGIKSLQRMPMDGRGHNLNIFA